MSVQSRSTAARRALAAAGSFALAVGLGAAGVVGAAVPASAHNVVVGTSPTSGSTVTEPPESVDVTFDDVVLDLSAEGSSTVLTVTDPDGTNYATGCPTTQDRTVSVPVALGVGGEYTVDWRIVSADGHPTSGEFSFTYDPPAGAEAAAPAADAAPCDAAGTAGDDASGGAADPAAGGASEADAPSGDGSASELAVVLGIAGGVVVLAGAAVLVALRLARRRG
ncbi:copper resistance CopC family protein [Isoptericola sp. NPDC019482]|uniref:copper resistance CopC family protein n=1 Tax=Isoptericola sp. NPDC019482 TaxID=3154688 RepID=UPI0034803E55